MYFMGIDLKEYQVFSAAVLALIAAIITFAGVQLNAFISYKSAQRVADKNIIFARNQADAAAHNRRTAVVTWLYLRVVEARNRMGSIYVDFYPFDSVWAMVKEKSASEIREDKGFRSVMERILAIEPVLDSSDISAVELEFLVGLDHRDQELFFSAFSGISTFDDHVRDIQRHLTAFLNNPIQDHEDIEILRRNSVENMRTAFRMFHERFEKSVADTYSELRAISKQHAAGQS
jgi:hypothetical protein